MQATQDAIARSRVVLLHEIVGDAGVAVALLGEGFEKEAALVAEIPRLDQ